MLGKQTPFWLTMLLLVALTVAACAPRAGGGEVLQMEGASDLALDLPALVVDFDEAGQPSVADVSLKALADQFAPGALDSMVLSADLVKTMTDSGIQHIQVSNSPDGVIVQVNGEAVPSIRWDSDSLANSAQLISLAGVDLGSATAAVETLLPLVNRFGIGIIARFPVAEDAVELSFVAAGTSESGMAAKEAQESFLQTVRNQPAIAVPIFYDAQGAWRVGDLTSDEWISLTGMPVFDSFRLRPEVVDRLMKQGVTEFALYTDTEGIHVSINGESLPYIGWADGELNNVMKLAGQMGLWDALEAQNMNVDDIAMMLDTLLPVVQSTEITLTAHFPEDIAAATN